MTRLQGGKKVVTTFLHSNNLVTRLYNVVTVLKKNLNPTRKIDTCLQGYLCIFLVGTKLLVTGMYIHVTQGITVLL